MPVRPPRPHAPAPRMLSIIRACDHSVNRHTLSTYCVPGPCWLLGLPWEPTQAHPELREERESPLKPGGGARCCTPHTRDADRPVPSGGLGSRKRVASSAADPYLPSPGHGNSDPSLVLTSSRFSPPSDAECNPCIFSDWSKKEKKKTPLQDTPSRAAGRSVMRDAQGGRPLMGPRRP